MTSKADLMREELEEHSSDPFKQLLDRFRDYLDARNRNIIYLSTPDVYSNSIYLLVADATPEIKQEILNIVEAPENVTICFIDAPASREMMLKWLNHLITRLEGLEGSRGMMPDGRLYVGLREGTPGNVRAVLMALDGYVPPGLLVIREDTM